MIRYGMNIVYYSSGMKHFGERMVKDMNFKKYDPLADVDKEVFFQGLYFQEDYDAFRYHEGPRVLYWNGSDVIRTLQNPSWLRTVKECPARHLCHSAWQSEVLRRVGLDVEIYPIFFGNLDKFQVCYKQSNTPHVYLTSHNGRDNEYGVDELELAAPFVPEVTIHVYGSSRPTKNKNIIYHGWIDEEVMDEEIKNYQGAIKGGSDGISITLIKSIMMGQYPISYKKIDGVWHAPDVETLIQRLKDLKDQKEPNYELVNKFKNHFKPYGK